MAKRLPAVRKAAAQLDVHRTTAFRWRHRFLTVPHDVKAQHLDGIVEADETYFLRSYKGQPQRLGREQSRQARRRGGRAAKRGLSDEQVPVSVARNRAGHTTDALLGKCNKHGRTRHCHRWLRPMWCCAQTAAAACWPPQPVNWVSNNMV